jgi:hypothetical protein
VDPRSWKSRCAVPIADAILALSILTGARSLAERYKLLSYALMAGNSKRESLVNRRTRCCLSTENPPSREFLAEP